MSAVPGFASKHVVDDSQYPAKAELIFNRTHAGVQPDVVLFRAYRDSALTISAPSETDLFALNAVKQAAAQCLILSQVVQSFFVTNGNGCRKHALRAKAQRDWGAGNQDAERVLR